MSDEQKPVFRSPFYRAPRDPHKKSQWGGKRKKRPFRKTAPDKIPKDDVILLAEKFYRISEIAACYGVSDEYVRVHYGDDIKLAHSRARGRLREIQWNAAKKGDVKMIIHLSKHQLGEHDQQKFQLQSFSNEQLASIIQQRLDEEKTKQLPKPIAVQVIEATSPQGSESEDAPAELIPPEEPENQ